MIIYKYSYTMGGFTLRGPTHTIKSTAPIRCRCLGYSGRIDREVQDFLMQKHEHILDLAELPDELHEEMIQCHLTDDMRYEIYLNPVSKPYIPPVYNPNVW